MYHISHSFALIHIVANPFHFLFYPDKIPSRHFVRIHFPERLVGISCLYNAIYNEWRTLRYEQRTCFCTMRSSLVHKNSNFTFFFAFNEYDIRIRISNKFNHFSVSHKFASSVSTFRCSFHIVAVDGSVQISTSILTYAVERNYVELLRYYHFGIWIAVQVRRVGFGQHNNVGMCESADS